jgi:hypothetical protein
MLTLRVLSGFKPPVPCDDRSYTCMCEFHVAERAALVVRGIRPDLPQPWQAVRPPELSTSLV